MITDGIICWAMSVTEAYEDRDEQFSGKGFENFISTLCDKRKWISISGYPKPVQNYSYKKSGWFYGMKVL